MIPAMDTPMTQSASTTALHARRARYFRTMALTASTADVAITLVRLALHYEQLATENALGTASANVDDGGPPMASRQRQRRSTK
jgi:hypothetical protein